MLKPTPQLPYHLELRGPDTVVYALIDNTSMIELLTLLARMPSPNVQEQNAPNRRRNAGNRPLRIPKPNTLIGSLLRVIGDRVVSGKEATAAVLAAGYKSTARLFPELVQQALASNRYFERVERGRYRIQATVLEMLTANAIAPPTNVGPDVLTLSVELADTKH